MLGDGKQVDLYKLFSVVKGKGGYDAVSNRKLWDLVGEESGLGVSVGSSVKLLYSKYLSALEAWVKKVADSKVSSERGLVDNRDEFRRRLAELQAEVKGLLSENDAVIVGEKIKGGFEGECKLNSESNGEIEGCFDFDSEMLDRFGNEVAGFDGECKLNSESNGEIEGCFDSEIPDMINESVIGKLCESNDALEVGEEIDGGKLSAEPVVGVFDVVKSNESRLFSEGKNRGDDSGDNSAMVLDPSRGDGENSGLKRKRESLFDFVSWVSGVAKDPCDPAVGSMPEKSRWKSYSNQEVWKQVLLFRKAAFHKKSFESSSEEQNWQSQKMHPFLYEDQLGAIYNLRQRLKPTQKKLLIRKQTSSLRSSSSSSVGAEGDSDRTPSPRTNGDLDKTPRHHLDRCPAVRTRVGRNHQAELPEWTCKTSFEGDATIGDSKWLGIQTWPLEKASSKVLIERDPIGKGRQDSCGCAVPGSVDCVRFHIAGKRAKLKLEIGAAFYRWNFDKAGEDVRRFWRDEDEKKFKDVIESNPPSECCFWDHIFRAFPSKSREDLVSYYHNVSLLQRRAYQNRYTPDDINSDDEQPEFGLRNVFGHQTQKSRGSILLTPQKPQTKGKQQANVKIGAPLGI